MLRGYNDMFLPYFLDVVVFLNNLKIAFDSNLELFKLNLLFRGENCGEVEMQGIMYP